MNYLSLFSGIEAATVAWHPLGWKPVAFSEIDKTASKFLAETYPHVPNLGDVTKITEEKVKSLGKIDLIIFGSPCQDLSIAGKQRGLDGARSGLFRDSIRIIQWARKHCGLRFALWENVPGAYSSNKGRDFTEVVASLAGLENLDTPENGWGKEGAAIGDNGLLEWACLDAQWFGLAARRKRVFALVDFGDWESRPPILLEPEGLRGDFAPSRRTGEGSSASVTGGLRNGSHWDDPENPHPTLNQSHNAGGIGGSNQELFSQRGAYLCEGAIDSSLGGSLPNEVIGTLLSDSHSGGGKPLPAVAYCIQATTIDRSDTAGANGAGFSEELAFTLNTVDRHATVFSFDSLSSNSMKSSNPDSGCREVDLAKTLDTTTPCPSKNQGGIAILNPPIVRRLTPLECERLQGFPEIERRVQICIGNQKSLARVESQSLKLQNAALNAERTELKEAAPSAQKNLNVKGQSGRLPVALNVTINLEKSTLQIFRQAKLPLSVNLAEEKNSSPHLTHLGDIARLLVQQMKGLGLKATNGKEGSQQNTKHSLAQENGSLRVNLFGQEIEELVNDVGLFTEKVNDYMKSTTKEVGLNSKNCEQSLRTLCCFALVAINLFIREKIPSKSLYELNLSITHGYTASMSNSQRYRTLGNSMAVPVIRYIGERIMEAFGSKNNS